MVNLLTLAATLEAGSYLKLTKQGSPNLAAEISLVLFPITIPQLLYYICSLSLKHFVEIFDAVCDFQNLERKQAIQCLRVLNEFII